MAGVSEYLEADILSVTLTTSYSYGTYYYYYK